MKKVPFFLLLLAMLVVWFGVPMSFGESPTVLGDESKVIIDSTGYTNDDGEEFLYLHYKVEVHSIDVLRDAFNIGVYPADANRLHEFALGTCKYPLEFPIAEIGKEFKVAYGQLAHPFFKAGKIPIEGNLGYSWSLVPDQQIWAAGVRFLMFSKKQGERIK